MDCNASAQDKDTWRAIVIDPLPANVENMVSSE